MARALRHASASGASPQAEQGPQHARATQMSAQQQRASAVHIHTPPLPAMTVQQRVAFEAAAEPRDGAPLRLRQPLMGTGDIWQDGPLLLDDWWTPSVHEVRARHL